MDRDLDAGLAGDAFSPIVKDAGVSTPDADGDGILDNEDDDADGDDAVVRQ